MSKDPKSYPPITDKPVKEKACDDNLHPFNSTVEAWFWFIQAQQAKNEGARYTAGMSLTPRPCEHGIFDVDQEMNEKLHENGFTNDQVQVVYDLAAEKMISMIIEMAGDFQAEREVEKLIEHFGGAEKWQEVSRQLLAFGQKNMPEDVLDSLSSSFEGVIALHNMMKGEEPNISHTGKSDNSGEMDLQSMMRDPKYWRDKDPSFVAKVTEGFQKMYSSK